MWSTGATVDRRLGGGRGGQVLRWEVTLSLCITQQGLEMRRPSCITSCNLWGSASCRPLVGRLCCSYCQH